MTGVEIDFVVKDSLKAIEFYEKIFDLERIEVTDFPRGQNEVVFSIYGTRFHMLDENEEFHLMAPKEDVMSVWFNVMVPDIKVVHEAAIGAGCKQIQDVTEMMDFGVSNSIFTDPFGYLWMLHQIHKNVSFKERVEYHENQMNKEK